jgi:patatin-like phospholipase/acyl hydrolase
MKGAATWLCRLAMTAAILGSIVSVEGEDDKVYNILAIDGGGIRGIIPAQVLIFVEKFAYDYAKERNYNVPKYTDKDGKEMELVHLKDVFDMMAGTSTGSIISAALAYPHPDDKDKPKE